MKRVSIIGSGGAGKSTLARRLGEITGLPVIHLDALHWKPNWTEPPKDEWRRTVEELVKGDRWIIDGNFGGTMDIRLAASDTVIFLDYSRFVCVARAVKRAIKHWNQTRPDMGEGCPEKLDLKFLGWIWNFPVETRPRIEQRLSESPSTMNVLRLNSSKVTEKFLRKMHSSKDA